MPDADLPDRVGGRAVVSDQHAFGGRRCGSVWAPKQFDKHTLEPGGACPHLCACKRATDTGCRMWGVTTRCGGGASSSHYQLLRLPRLPRRLPCALRAATDASGMRASSAHGANVVCLDAWCAHPPRPAMSSLSKGAGCARGRCRCAQHTQVLQPTRCTPHQAAAPAHIGASCSVLGQRAHMPPLFACCGGLHAPTVRLHDPALRLSAGYALYLLKCSSCVVRLSGRI
jgi:hypothetical protein